MRYLAGALHVLAGLVLAAFVVGLVVGLGARLTLALGAWVKRRAEHQRERVLARYEGNVGQGYESKTSTSWRGIN